MSDALLARSPVNKLKQLERYENDSLSLIDYMMPAEPASSPDSLISDFEEWTALAETKSLAPAKPRKPSLMRRLSDIRGLRGARVTKSKLRG